MNQNCGKCHTCGTDLKHVLDGEEYCPICETYRRYQSHGWNVSRYNSLEENILECPDKSMQDIISNRFTFPYENVIKLAVSDVLDGFRDLAEAQEFFRDFKDRDMIGYTALGLEISPQALQWAIRYKQAETWTKKPSILEEK